MYINFWYPIIRSEDLANDKPEKVKVLGCNLVVFRDEEGDAKVLSDTCVHRGGSLGGAWSAGPQVPRIVNGCVVCPYHGWEFGGDGECKNIPSIGYGKKPPARAKMRNVTASFLPSSATCRKKNARRCLRSRNTTTRPGARTPC